MYVSTTAIENEIGWYQRKIDQCDITIKTSEQEINQLNATIEAAKQAKIDNEYFMQLLSEQLAKPETMPQ